MVREETVEAVRQQAWNDIATLIALFPSTCEGINFGVISPNGKWFAVSYYEPESLIVENMKGRNGF
jgi:hypothetical protein